jgi:hypothetical protein
MRTEKNHVLCPVETSMHGKIKYEFTAKVWQHPGPGGWHFISLPSEIAREIRENLKWQEEGWGRMKATAQSGDCIWDTAIWYDKKHQTYLLPVKAAIRKKLKMDKNQDMAAIVWL